MLHIGEDRENKSGGEPMIQNAGCGDGWRKYVQFCFAHNGGAPGVVVVLVLAEWRERAGINPC